LLLCAAAGLVIAGWVPAGLLDGTQAAVREDGKGMRSANTWQPAGSLTFALLQFESASN
jgi:hypothetical protein